MAAPKTSTPARRTPARKPAATTRRSNPIKPKYQVVGSTLYAQTEDGEVTLSLRCTLGTLEDLANLEHAEIDDLDKMRQMLALVPDGDVLRSLDIAEAMPLLAQWAEAVGERAGKALTSSN